ncbi:MAG: AtzE family amidohydrolase [Actinomycetota bacterium]|nr:AtzE family amidohydrolase [Actinomycetota bacterium]
MTAPVDASGIVAAVRTGSLSAGDALEQALAAAHGRGVELNCFSEIVEERARRDAAAVDAAIGEGRDPGPLAGVPFAVKDLFDVCGVVTRSGSKIDLDRPAAGRDAVAVERLRAAGATLLATTVMDEYAYGFTSENTHYGPVCNPCDGARVAGGSSGGSAAAVGGGIVPLALGSDTNGSVRVPAALCGVLGLKPTYGAISTRGMHTFAASLDHVGLFARTVADLAIGFELLRDDRPAGEPDRGPPRIAVAGGHFRAGAHPGVLERVDQLATQLGATREIELAGATEARAAAMVVTAAEGAQLHLKDLRTRADEFDPMTRDRFLAGALVPASAYLAAQRFRAWFRAEVARTFEQVDVLLAPSTPFPAPLIGQREEWVDGETVLTQPYLGVFTQPLSFIGLPVLNVRAGLVDGLPVGAQLVARPFAERILLELGARIEARAGSAAGSPVARDTGVAPIHQPR